MARHILIRVHMPRNLLASTNTERLRVESDTTYLRKLRKHLPKQSSTSIIFEQRRDEWWPTLPVRPNGNLAQSFGLDPATISTQVVNSGGDAELTLYRTLPNYR
jgi:hypothetical protein